MALGNRFRFIAADSVLAECVYFGTDISNSDWLNEHFDLRDAAENSRRQSGSSSAPPLDGAVSRSDSEALEMVLSRIEEFQCVASCELYSMQRLSRGTEVLVTNWMALTCRMGERLAEVANVWHTRNRPYLTSPQYVVCETADGKKFLLDLLQAQQWNLEQHGGFWIENSTTLAGNREELSPLQFDEFRCSVWSVLNSTFTTYSQHLCQELLRSAHRAAGLMRTADELRRTHVHSISHWFSRISGQQLASTDVGELR
jgi:hypothetical protein